MEYRELLEKAAVALGKPDGWQHIFEDWDGESGDDYDWNPMESDSDAFAAAADLGMCVMFPDSDDPWAVVHIWDDRQASRVMSTDRTSEGFRKATRHAITECAAKALTDVG